VLAELLEQDHRQQARAGKAARRHPERRRRLRDLLAAPAGELLPHRLDHLPLPRHHLQRLADVLAQLREIVGPAARAAHGGGDHHALARQVLGERLARRPTALVRCHQRIPARLRCGFLVFGGPRLQVLQLQLQLVEQPRLVLRARAVQLTPQLLDRQLQVRDQSLAGGVDGLGIGGVRFGRHPRGALGEDHRVRGGEVGGERCGCGHHQGIESYPLPGAKPEPHPTDVGRQVFCGLRQSMPSSR